MRFAERATSGACCAAALWVLTACSASSGGEKGPVADCRAAAEPPAFVIATYNIHAGLGRDGRRDLARTAHVVAGAQLVGYQEVDQGRPRSDFANQAARLADLLHHAYWEHFAAERYWPMGGYGTGLSTSLRVVATGSTALPGDGRAKRRLASVTFLVNCRPVHAFIFHGARSGPAGELAKQIAAAEAQIDREAPGQTDAVIWMGDFNVPSDDPALAHARARYRDITADRPDTARGPDHILLRGPLTPVSLDVRDDPASDHPAVLATLH
jgi:endonuclease/exonuclease/phosphatase family metal-dependent hydrolase